MADSAITVQACNRFADLKQAFPELFAARTGRELFYTPEWFATLAEHGHTFEGRLQLIVAHETRSGSVLCLPGIDGKHLTGLSNYYSGLYAPIAAQEPVGEEMYDALGQWIAAHPSRWPVIDFHPIDNDEPFFGRMQSALRNAGYWSDSYSCFGNWYHRTSGQTFAEYLAGRPTRLQNTIRRNTKKIQSAGQVEIEIHQQAGPALDAAIENFASIYRQSWKPAESHPEFIAELCKMAAAQGWLRLGILKLNSQAIAAQIWLTYGGKANIFKLAYTPENKPYSAGTLLTAEMMRQAIDIDRADEIDYLCGDDAYKKDWMSERRERKGIVAFRPGTLGGLLAGSRHFIGKLKKRTAWNKFPGRQNNQAAHV